jgi:dihydroorotate dehydrogenase (NAD+) catalytic subunit
MDLQASICGIKLKNPLILASGVLGLNKNNLLIAQRGGAGALTIKSITLEKRSGHDTPNVAFFEAGMLNAFGYCNIGLAAALKEFADLSCFSVPVFASCTASDAHSFAKLVGAFDKLGFAAIELPVSCPHTPGHGLLAGQSNIEKVKAIIRACRKETKKPIFLKINAGLPNFVEIALAAEKAGADAITCSNTLGPGMVIDVNTAKPVLSFKVGGVSGPAIRPIVVRAIYELYERLRIPIIGLGGVSRGEHAIEMLMAGANAVGIATGVLQRGPCVFRKCCKELAQWMEKHGYRSIGELVGLAHQ